MHTLDIHLTAIYIRLTLLWRNNVAYQWDCREAGQQGWVAFLPSCKAVSVNGIEASVMIAMNTQQ